MIAYIENKDVISYELGFVQNIPVLPYKCDCVVCFDPSKTNMAVLIANLYGDVLSTLEFTGNNRRKGPTEDTTKYCSEVTEFLQYYLKDVNICFVFIEQNIMKKGYEYYQSSNVLTEIRGALLHFFETTYNIRAKEINNWSWKSHVLPDGYRSRNEKGSKRYIHDYFPDSALNNYFEADMTDVFCMYLYAKTLIPASAIPPILCQQKESALGKINVCIVPRDLDMGDSVIFQYNPNYSLMDNAIYYSNRLRRTGTTIAPVDKLSMEEIYEYSALFDNVTKASTVQVMVTCL